MWVVNEGVSDPRDLISYSTSFTSSSSVTPARTLPVTAAIVPAQIAAARVITFSSSGDLVRRSWVDSPPADGKRGQARPPNKGTTAPRHGPGPTASGCKGPPAPAGGGGDAPAVS